jgi:hypothetical protein
MKQSNYLILSGYLIGLPFLPESRGCICHRNVGKHLPHCKARYDEDGDPLLMRSNLWGRSSGLARIRTSNAIVSSKRFGIRTNGKCNHIRCTAENTTTTTTTTTPWLLVRKRNILTTAAGRRISAPTLEVRGVPCGQYGGSSWPPISFFRPMRIKIIVSLKSPNLKTNKRHYICLSIENFQVALYFNVIMQV